MQHAHVLMDEYERTQDGYAYNPSSDCYQTYAEASAEESKQTFEEPGVGKDLIQGFFSVMVRVRDGPGESALAVRQHS